MKAGLAMGMGCEEAKIFYHLLYIYKVPSGKYENIITVTS